MSGVKDKITNILVQDFDTCFGEYAGRKARHSVEHIMESITLTDAAALVEHLSGGKWKAVPVEPNEAMMTLGDQAIIDGLERAQTGFLSPKHPDHASHDIYKAMLAATPKPEDV